MTNFAESHTYLISQLILMSFYCTGLFVFFKKRKSIFISSLLALPQAFFSLILVPIYWNPQRIFFLGVGLEDFIFCFLTGGLAWMSILIFFSNRISFELTRKKLIANFVLCIIFGFISLSVLYFFNIRDIINPFIIMIFWSVLILIYRFEYLKLGLTGAFTFLIIYAFGIKIGLIIWPQLISLWTLKNLTNILILKIPIEELIWAFLYGASWNLAIAFIFDVRLRPVYNTENIEFKIT